VPQSLQNKEYRTFVNGLVTESSPLSFPENSSKDEDNFEINSKGYRQRRLGLDYETDYVKQMFYHEDEDFSNVALSVNHWKNVNNNPDNHLIVFQHGLFLRFFKANTFVVTTSTPNMSVEIELEGDKYKKIQAIEFNGDLIVACGDYCVYRLSWDESTETINIDKHGLLVRDIWGVEDGLQTTFSASVGDTSTYITDKNVYNLLNQGWAARISNSTAFPMLAPGLANEGYWPSHDLIPSTAWVETPPAVNEDTITKDTGNYTSKGHYIIDYFIRGYSRELVSSGSSLTDNFGYTWNNGNSGALIHLAEDEPTFDFDEFLTRTESDSFTTTLTGYSAGLGTDLLEWDGPAAESSDRRKGCTCIASYAGRLFYSGFTLKHSETDNRSLNIGNTVLFSQIVDSPDKIGKCYQEGDPTSHTNFDLVDSDGGFIVISDIGNATKMLTLADRLLVFSNNGIWSISGGETLFSAVNFVVEKISETICVSPDSIVVVDDVLYFWSDNGIYKLFKDKTTFSLLVIPVTNKKIQSFYKNLPQMTKIGCQGTYDKLNNTIRWLYNDEESYDGVSFRYNYNRQLNYNLDLESFYPFTFNEITPEEGETAPFVAGIFDSPLTNIELIEDLVVIGEDVVQVDGEDVFIYRNAPSSTIYSYKYLIIQEVPPTGYGVGNNYWWLNFGQLSNTDFLDWYSEDDTGIDAPGFLLTGHEMLGDTQRNKQVLYLTTHFERTETGFDESDDYSVEGPSGCLISAYWDFADHSNSGKITTPFQAYRLKRWYVPSDSSDPFNYGQSVITTKNKIRGRGKALSLRFETEPGKNCIPYGWGIVMTGNTSP
jgi:hypothetical protein